MKIQTIKRTPAKKKAQDAEVRKILANFYRESTLLVRNAIEASHKKHPEIFKSSE